MLKRSPSSRKKFVKKHLPCFFCKSKVELISYLDVELIGRFLTSRGKIIGRIYSGTCAQHQKALGRAIKRARVAALLPYTQVHALV